MANQNFSHSGGLKYQTLRRKLSLKIIIIVVLKVIPYCLQYDLKSLKEKKENKIFFWKKTTKIERERANEMGREIEEQINRKLTLPER